MSVLLEGNISKTDGQFTGKWRFMKENKNGNLKCEFTKQGNSIPRRLFNYVSFIDDGSSQVRARGRKARKLIKTSNSISTTDATTAPVDDSKKTVVVTSTSIENKVEGDADDEDEIINESNNATGGATNNDNTSSSNLVNTSDIEIPNTHHLFGYYEGSFDILTAQGMVSSDIQVDTENDANESDHENEDNEDSNDNLSGDLSLLPPPPYLSTTIKRSLWNYTPSSEINTATNIVQNNGGITAAYEAQTLVTMLRPNINYTRLYGYGRNQFGRFSILGLYDESTGDIFCEKKYMLSRLGNIKRGRLATIDNGGVTSKSERPGRELPKRMVKSINDSENVIPVQESKRKRTESSKWKELDSFSDIHHIGDNIGQSMSTAVNTPAHHVKTPRASLKEAKDSAHSKASFSSSSSGAYAGYDDSDDDDDDNKSYFEGYFDEENGEIYEGFLRDGKKHGLGLTLRADGTMYEGEYLFGREHGQGKLLTGERDVIYEGEFFEGNFSGHGRLHFRNGDTYVGEWKDGLRNGKGEYLFCNGCKYIGEFKENKRHGKGKFIWPDHSTYEGDWENDMRHGRGIIDLVNFFKYDGTWLCNFPEGKGWALFASGQEYQGSFKQGYREGRGSITFPEGAIYEGRFREDRIDGMGTVKVTHVVPGTDEGEIFIPVQVQADIKRIHLRAGFGPDSHGGH